MSKEQTQQVQHPDDLAVDLFAAEMKRKLAAKRADGRRGWESKAEVDATALQRMLLDHLHKGDPIDIGNFCMMLWNRQEPVVGNTYRIDSYDPEHPQLRIRFGSRELSFSLHSVAPEAHEWLGNVLERQIREIIEDRVVRELESHKAKLRALLGVR